MELHDFCRTLEFDAVWENKLFPVWEQLTKNTDDSLPDFMKEEFRRRYYPYCQGPENLWNRMTRVEEITAKTPVCARLAQIIRYAVFIAEPQISLGEWPTLEKFYGEDSGIFYLLVAMSALPLIERKHRELGLPEHYWQDAAGFIGGRMQLYAAAHNGQPGMISAFAFLRHHVDGHLFRIGRLEFMLQTPPEGFFPAVYVNRKDGSLQVLCRNQWRFDRNGLFVLDPREETAFTATLEITGSQVAGTPISPYGFPLTNRTVTLDLKEWEPFCTPWDLVPAIHIPGGGSITMDILKESMQEACSFFRKYFHQEVPAFTCASWLFNPDWETELPRSNMTQWQKNVYMCAVAKSPAAGLFFVYGRTGDPRQMQRTTSLHEAFCRLFDRNEVLKYGYTFIPVCDLEKFGTEFRRKQWDAAGLPRKS